VGYFGFILSCVPTTHLYNPSVTCFSFSGTKLFVHQVLDGMVDGKSIASFLPSMCDTSKLACNNDFRLTQDRDLGKIILKPGHGGGTRYKVTHPTHKTYIASSRLPPNLMEAKPSIRITK